jgi:hypothetical protein
VPLTVGVVVLAYFTNGEKWQKITIIQPASYVVLSEAVSFQT